MQSSKETSLIQEVKDLEVLHPALLILYTATVLYCNEYDLPCVVTSTNEDRSDLNESTTVHRDGRGLDLSVKGWTDVHIHRFVYLMNKDYEEIAAISDSDGKPRAVVYHNVGHGDHLHLQVRPDAKITKFVSWKHRE